MCELFEHEVRLYAQDMLSTFYNLLQDNISIVILYLDLCKQLVILEIGFKSIALFRKLLLTRNRSYEIENKS
jgi:hypothetical protein